MMIKDMSLAQKWELMRSLANHMKVVHRDELNHGDEAALTDIWLAAYAQRRENSNGGASALYCEMPDLEGSLALTKALNEGESVVQHYAG